MRPAAESRWCRVARCGTPPGAPARCGPGRATNGVQRVPVVSASLRRRLLASAARVLAAPAPRGASATCGGCAQAHGQHLWKPAAQALGPEGSMSPGRGLGLPLDAPSPWRGTCQGPGPPAVMAYAPQVLRALSASPAAGGVQAQPLGAPRAGESAATLPLGPPPGTVGLSAWGGSACACATARKRAHKRTPLLLEAHRRQVCRKKEL